MEFFKLRHQRLAVELSVKAFLQEKLSGKISTQYSAGTIINISRGGAYIVFDKVFLGDEHLFYTTQEDSHNVLHLTGFPMDINGEYLLATTVWMDSCIFKKKPSFKLGVHFIEEQPKLLSLLREKAHIQ